MEQSRRLARQAIALQASKVRTIIKANPEDTLKPKRQKRLIRGLDALVKLGSQA